MQYDAHVTMYRELQALNSDLLLYGQYFVRHNADGTKERIDPKEIYNA